MHLTNSSILSGLFAAKEDNKKQSMEHNLQFFMVLINFIHSIDLKVELIQKILLGLID
jgi:hypothetical protein